MKIYLNSISLGWKLWWFCFFSFLQKYILTRSHIILVHFIKAEDKPATNSQYLSFQQIHAKRCSRKKKMKLSSIPTECLMHVSKLIFPLHLSPLIPLSIHKSHAKTRYIRKCINHKMFAYTNGANTFCKYARLHCTDIHIER